jgi:putative NADPH-quinone reductase
MRILSLNAHPDEGSFCDAIAAAYLDGARAGGHGIRSIARRELRFDPGRPRAAQDEPRSPSPGQARPGRRLLGFLLL